MENGPMAGMINNFTDAHVLAERLYTLQKCQTDRIEGAINDLVKVQASMQLDIAAIKNSWPCTAHEAKLEKLIEDVEILKTSRTRQNTVISVFILLYTGIVTLFSGWFHR
jgi:hypothetical protein